MTRLLFISTLVACQGKNEETPTGETGDPGPETVTDRFLQDLHTPLDILWVVDPGWSGGMDALADKEILEEMHETVLSADPSWRMGIISANAPNNRFGVIGLKWETYPPPAEVFDPPASSSPPRVRDAIWTALELRKDQTNTAEFIRKDAHLYVIVYTDEDDASSEISQADFQQWFEGYKGSTSKRIGAITTSDRSDYWSNRVQGGVVFDVGSFRRAFDVVLRDAMNLRSSFTLSHEPVEPPATITLVYREQETELVLNEGFNYDPESRVISLIDFVPRPTSEIFVTYEPSADSGGDDDDDDNDDDGGEE